jgi:hypothetical protein
LKHNFEYPNNWPDVFTSSLERYGCVELLGNFFPGTRRVPVVENGQSGDDDKKNETPQLITSSANSGKESQTYLALSFASPPPLRVLNGL